MAKSLKNAGDVNLRGKKTKLMRCKCCECVDFRDKIKYYEDLKLIRKYLRGKEDEQKIFGVFRH